MKEKSLLRRYRWPLFILLWGAGQFAGTMFLYGRPGDALYGFIAALGVGTISAGYRDWETRERNESPYIVTGKQIGRAHV